VTKIADTLHEDQYKIFISSRSVIITIFQTNFVEKIKGHVPLYYFENRAVFEIMWKSITDPDRPQKQYGEHTLHAGHLRLLTHSHNM
jgi:hypothetical protein